MRIIYKMQYRRVLITGVYKSGVFIFNIENGENDEIAVDTSVECLSLDNYRIVHTEGEKMTRRFPSRLKVVLRDFETLECFSSVHEKSLRSLYIIQNDEFSIISVSMPGRSEGYVITIMDFLEFAKECKA